MRTGLLEAMALLRLHGVSALPVVDAGTLVGLVTERDLLRGAEGLLRYHRRPEARGWIPPMMPRRGQPRPRSAAVDW